MLWNSLNMVIAALLFVVEPPLLKGILFGLSFFMASNMMPFVNGAGFYYERCGVELNFGLARGMGSLFFSFIAFILGNVFDRFGGNSVIIASLVISTILFISIMLMPYSCHTDIKLAGEAYIPEMAHSGFMKRYPRFMGMMVAFLLLMIFHNSTNNYMLQIMQQVGGGSKEMSFALSLSGLVEVPAMLSFVWVKKKASSSTLLLISALAFVAKASGYLLAGAVIGVVLTQLLQSVSFALYTSASVYYAMEQMSGADMLRGQSMISSVSTLGVVLGNVLGGFVIQQLGIRINLWFAFTCAIIGAILVFFLRERIVKHQVKAE